MGDGAAGSTADGSTSDDPDADQFAQIVRDAQGPSVISIVGWIVAGAALLGGVWLMFRSRHRAEEDDEPSDDEDATVSAPETVVEAKEPVAAGKWSLKEE
jgi:hypothetical protein